MKVTFAIFFCVIVGVTTAKHLVKEEYKGFETDKDLDALQLIQNDIEYDDPRMEDFKLTEGFKILAECLDNGDSEDCFKEFKEFVHLPQSAAHCFGSFKNCIAPGKFLECADAFEKCVHHHA